MEENNEQTAVTRVNNKLALTSFVLSLVGLIIAGIPCGIAALITGIIGLTKFDQEKEKNKWMAIVGIIVGVMDAVLVAVALPAIYKSLGIY